MNKLLEEKAMSITVDSLSKTPLLLLYRCFSSTFEVIVTTSSTKSSHFLQREDTKDHICTPLMDMDWSSRRREIIQEDVFGQVVVESVCFFDDETTKYDESEKLLLFNAKDDGLSTIVEDDASVEVSTPLYSQRSSSSFSVRGLKRRNSQEDDDDQAKLKKKPLRSKPMKQKQYLSPEDLDLTKKRMSMILMEEVDSSKQVFEHLIWMTSDIRERIKFLNVFDLKEMNDLLIQIIMKEDSLSSLFSLNKNLCRSLFSKDDFEGKNISSVMSSFQFKLLINIYATIFGFSNINTFKKDSLYSKLLTFVKIIMKSKNLNRSLLSSQDVECEAKRRADKSLSTSQHVLYPPANDNYQCYSKSSQALPINLIVHQL